jgi:hypothetical protein
MEMDDSSVPNLPDSASEMTVDDVLAFLDLKPESMSWLMEAGE